MAIPDDASAIAALVTHVATEHIGPSLTASALHRLLVEMDEPSTKRRIFTGWPHWCVIRDGVIRAVLVVRPPVHLYHLFVQTSEQRQGFARQLLKKADEQTLVETGTILQTVNASLNAVDVYRRLGFQPVGSVCDVDGVRFQPMIRSTR